jgi:C4-dicarboxylate-specific signal transduction histidine kinase
LQQVILNLVINALEAMSGVGKDSRRLLVSTKKNGSGEVLVIVQDSGPGLNGECGDRLFDPFYTTKSNGMGMGLSICRSIIQDHGGRIWPSPKPGPGASIQFTLPSEVASERVA